MIEIIVAVIGTAGLVLVAVLPIMLNTQRHAKEANQAVNCRPAGAPKISEQVDQIAGDLASLRHVSADVAHVKRDVRELRREQAALAVAFGEHLSTTED